MKEKWADLKVGQTRLVVSDETMINRMIEDIKESDADTLTELIEHMYPVTATYDHEFGEITLESNKKGLTLNDIF